MSSTDNNNIDKELLGSFGYNCNMINPAETQSISPQFKLETVISLRALARSVNPRQHCFSSKADYGCRLILRAVL